DQSSISSLDNRDILMQKELKDLVVGDDVLVTENHDEKKHPAKVIQVDREKGTFRVHYMGWRASYDRDFSYLTKDVVFFHKPARPLQQPRYEIEAQVIAVYRKDGQRYGGVIKKAEAHPDCPIYVVKFYDGVRQLKTRETDISPYSEEEAERGKEFAEMRYNKEAGSSADEDIERPSPRSRTDSESSVKTNNSEPPTIVDLNSPGMRVKPRRSSGRVSKRRSSISRPSPLVANSISSEQDRPSPSSLPRNVSKSEKSAFAPAKSAKKASPAIGESLEIESSFDFVEETSDKVAIKLSTSAEKSVSEAGGVEQEAASGQRAWLGRAHASRDSTVPTRKSVSRHFAESPGQGTRTRSLRERKSSENQKTEDNPKTGESVRRSSPRKQPAKAELQEGTAKVSGLPKPKLATPSQAVPTRASAVSERLNSIGSDGTARDSGEGTQVSPPKRSTRLGKSAEMEELRHLLGAEGFNKKVKIFTLEKWWLGKVIPPRGKIPKEVDIATHVFCHFFNWPRRSDSWFKCTPEFLQFVPHVEVPDKHLFKVGERVLAEWKSTRASAEGIWCAASVQALLPKTMYQVVFDDGIQNKLTHDRVKLMTPAMEKEAKKNLDEFLKKLADEIPKEEKIDVTTKPVRQRKSIYGSVPSKRSASDNENPRAAKKAKVAPESKAKETAVVTSSKKAAARRTPRKNISADTEAAIKAASSSGNLSRPDSRNSGNVSPFSELASASRPDSRPTTPGPDARPITPVLTDANSAYVTITGQLNKYDELDNELRELEDELKKNIEERERRIRDGLLVEYDGIWYNLVGGQEGAIKMIKFILDKPESQIAKSVKTDAVNGLERTLEAGVILDVDGEIDNLKDSQSKLVAELLSLREKIEKQDVNYDYCFFDKQTRCFMRAQFCKPDIWRQVVLHLRYQESAKACEIYQSANDTYARNLAVSIEKEEVRKRMQTQKATAEKVKVEKKKSKKVVEEIKKEQIKEEAKVDEANMKEEVSIVIKDQPATQREGRPRATSRRASSAKSGAPRRTPAATRRASIAASSSETGAASKLLRKAAASASTTPISSPARSRSPAVSLAGSDVSNSSASRRTRTRLSLAPGERAAAAKYTVGDLIWARWKDTRAYGGIVVDVLDKFYVFRFALDGIEANIAFDRTEGLWEPELRPDEDFLKFYENLRRDSDSKKVKTALLNAKVAFEKMLKAKKNPKVEKSPPKSSEKKTAPKAGKDKSLGTLVQRLAKKKMEEEEGASSSTPPAPELQKAPEAEKQHAPLKKSRKTSKPSRLSQDPPEINELSKEEKENKLSEMRDYIEKVSKKVVLEDQKKEKERLRKIKPILPGEVINIDDDEVTEVKKEIPITIKTESEGTVADAIVEQPTEVKKNEKLIAEEEKPTASTDSSPVRRSRRVRAQTDSEASPQQEKVKLSVRSSSQEQLKSPTRAQRLSVSPEKVKSPPKSPKVSIPAAHSTPSEKVQSPGRPKVQKPKSPARSAPKPNEANAKSPARAATDVVETKEEGVKTENPENEDKIAKRTRRRTNTINSSPARSPAARTITRKRKNSELKASPKIGKIRKLSETVAQSPANTPIPEIPASKKEATKEMVAGILRDLLFTVVKKSNAKTYRRIAKEKKARLAAQAAPPKSVSSPAPPTRQVCPVKSCNKTFRKTGHLQGHLKHYHADYLRENMDDLLGSTDDEGAEAASSADEDEWTRSPATIEREEVPPSPKKEYVTVPTTGTFEDILMPDFSGEQDGFSLEEALAIEEPVEPKKGYVCACGAWEGKELYYKSEEHKGQPHR
ncbi:unnamed protein product, partial [Oikopleura dioica]